MRQYLERVFPVLSKENDETAANRTWHLYDMMNFLEFVIFLMLRTVLGTLFTMCFVIAKFGVVLFLTYAFAYSIFYYLDRFGLVANNGDNDRMSPSTSKLKRPSDFMAWQENNKKTYPYVVDYDSKLDGNDNDNKSTLEGVKSQIRPDVLLDKESHISGESVVRVGSFKRPSSESGQQSIVGRALADLANIETKTYSKESKPESISITKDESEENKSSNA